MPHEPRVTVLMAVHNDAPFVARALSSIVGQSFDDFVVVVVDDASTDGSADIVRSFADRRIRILCNAENLGLTRSLQLGMAEATGQYLARMDADDVARRDRLAKQVAFLDAHPRVGILGTACRSIDVDDRPIGEVCSPCDDLSIRWFALLGNPFIHPSVMLRRSVLLQHNLNYDPVFRTAQDYDLWARLLVRTEGANLSEPLIDYRIRDGVSARRRIEQLGNHDLVAWRQIIDQFGSLRFNAAIVSALRTAFIGGSSSAAIRPGDRAALSHLYLRLLAAFSARYNQHPRIARLVADEALKAIDLATRQPSSIAAVGVVGRAVTMADPSEMVHGLARVFTAKLMRQPARPREFDAA